MGSTPFFMGLSGTSTYQPESYLFLILLVEFRLLHHRLNPYIRLVVNGAEPVEQCT